MKQKVFALLTASLFVLALFTGCGAVPSTTPTPSVPATAAEPAPTTEPAAAAPATESAAPPAGTLTQTDAEAVALEHAGAAADQVKFLHSEYEIDDRIPQYDVEFYWNNTEYNYEIHAETGEILSFERDT